MPERIYALPFPIFWTLRDIGDDERLKRLEFHLKSGDYFPMLATILGFLEETVKECETGQTKLAPTQVELIKKVRKDLMHLHKNYRIAPKEK